MKRETRMHATENGYLVTFIEPSLGGPDVRFYNARDMGEALAIQYHLHTSGTLPVGGIPEVIRKAFDQEGFTR